MKSIKVSFETVWEPPLLAVYFFEQVPLNEHNLRKFAIL